MERNNAVCWMILLLVFQDNKASSIIKCERTDNNLTYYENSVHAENTYADFSHPLTSGDSDFRIEIKLCENGTLAAQGVCKCRWISGQGPVCKNLTNDSICGADNSTMRFSLLIKSEYSDVLWIFFKQNATAVVLKHTTLHVTYPSKITGMYVNGEEINDTHLLDENREVNVSCLFTRGSPPLNVCLVSDTGQEQSICREEGPLTLSLGVYKCDDMWPTVRCEAPGSELNRSVAILFKCLRIFSDTISQVLDLTKFIGLTFRLKSYTNNSIKCTMALASLHPQSLELFCELSGKVPDFNLTLGFGDNKSRITEGNWTLKVTNEQGNASISFVLCNTTAEDKSQGTGYVSPVSPNALIITWCLLCVGIFIVSFSSVSVIYIIKLRRRDCMSRKLKQIQTTEQRRTWNLMPLTTTPGTIPLLVL
ncbi:uncharacterized protein LOC112568032 isoform X2 [Pomacea canaliculata]|uniref:uncharacterized protein LOC112568032 isoform X2 n=1 Tax=Pomacea canaliculata TaxID=400727 RepID=UPI000D7388A8|nr:uncharacterized protein LOC112568032 isoform X2 [Pomacea canaliculata]